MIEFNSLGAFGRHLTRLALEGEAVTHHITAEGAEHIQHAAQKKIGEYQSHSGPFPGWPELAESTKADRAAQGFPENEPLLRTGTLRDSIEVHQEGDKAVVGSRDEVALYQEVGTEKGIPPRPFLGPAAFEAKQPIGVIAGNTLIAWISGKGWKRPTKLIPSDAIGDL